MKGIVLGSTKGIGKAIADQLDSINIDVVRASSATLDTSSTKSIDNFFKNHKKTDILVLNTGGPPAKDFFSITESEWLHYYYQLFYGFIHLLQNVDIKNNGYIFLISSHTIKNPEENLILSNSFRVAFWSVLKTLSKTYASRNISIINIAPGPIKTKRLENLVSNIKDFEKSLPMKRAGSPEEIALFVKSIVQNNIKYLSGVTINFDGGLSNSLF
tara:strand:+ start:1533 stop:2177 length:645 start_codon:yes stop_codon:yes gene_type:complete